MNAKFSVVSVWATMLLILRNILSHILVSNIALYRFIGWQL